MSTVIETKGSDAREIKDELEIKEADNPKIESDANKNEPVVILAKYVRRYVCFRLVPNSSKFAIIIFFILLVWSLLTFLIVTETQKRALMISLFWAVPIVLSVISFTEERIWYIVNLQLDEMRRIRWQYSAWKSLCCSVPNIKCQTRRLFLPYLHFAAQKRQESHWVQRIKTKNNFTLLVSDLMSRQIPALCYSLPQSHRPLLEWRTKKYRPHSWAKKIWPSEDDQRDSIVETEHYFARRLLGTSEKTRNNKWTGLPNDVWKYIATFLSPDDLVILSYRVPVFSFMPPFHWSKYLVAPIPANDGGLEMFSVPLFRHEEKDKNSQEFYYNFDRHYFDACCRGLCIRAAAAVDEAEIYGRMPGHHDPFRQPVKAIMGMELSSCALVRAVPRISVHDHAYSENVDFLTGAREQRYKCTVLTEEKKEGKKNEHGECHTLYVQMLFYEFYLAGLARNAPKRYDIRS